MQKEKSCRHSARWFSRWRKFFRETKIINNINKILDKKAIIFINRRTVEFNYKTTPLNHDKLKLYKIAHCTKLHRWNAHVMLYIMLKSIRATSIQFWILQREINQIWTSLISNGFSFFQVQESGISIFNLRGKIPDIVAIRFCPTSMLDSSKRLERRRKIEIWIFFGRLAERPSYNNRSFSLCQRYKSQ